MSTTERHRRKTIVGEVVSDKMDKTVVVRVASVSRDPLYKKPLRRNCKFKAHDETNQCKVGDRVRIAETRPLSKEKRWRVLDVLERAK
ncbi:MAG: 30S ribosomal protein S17 [Armatimonadetes bacterium]|nr:30S ribosomal protein S17 [Armatimonadota bacterium]